MSLRNAFHKAAGLFVELPDQQESTFVPPDFSTQTPDPAPPTRTVADVVNQAPGPNLDQIKTPPDTAKSPPLTVGGVPDFKAIYESSGVPQAPFGADEAQQVIASLPVELPIEVKRKTVAATLTAMGKAMGVTTDTVVADASRKIAALNSFTEQLTAQTTQYQSMIEAHVADLKAQIAEAEAKHAQASQSLKSVVDACEKEGHRIDDVLEFFTLDAPPSKLA